MLDWCDRNGVGYIVGLARNAVLEREVQVACESAGDGKCKNPWSHTARPSSVCKARGRGSLRFGRSIVDAGYSDPTVFLHFPLRTKALVSVGIDPVERLHDLRYAHASHLDLNEETCMSRPTCADTDGRPTSTATPASR